MASLRDIRRRILGVKSTSKITQAMKMVSAAKLKRAQNSIESARPYVLKLEEMLSNLIDGIGDDYSHPLLDKRKSTGRHAIIVIGSDRGLCSSFNTNLFKYVGDQIGSLKASDPSAEISVIPVGRKATSFYSRSGLDVVQSFPGVFQNLQFETAQDIVKIASELYTSGKVDKVTVFFNRFVNIIRQVPMETQLLPLESKTLQADTSAKMKTDYIFEPDQKEILDVLLPKLVNISVWRSLLESNAAEHAARMMAMDNATRNAKDLINSLNLIYNRERQAAITTEMLEIVGGAEALNG